MIDQNQKTESGKLQELIFNFSLSDILEVGQSAEKGNMEVFVLFGIDFDSKIWATINTESSMKSFEPRRFAQFLKFKIPSNNFQYLHENVKNHLNIADNLALNLSLVISNEQKVEIYFWIRDDKNKVKLC